MSVIGFIDLPQIFGFATGLDNMAVIAGLGLAALAKIREFGSCRLLLFLNFLCL